MAHVTKLYGVPGSGKTTRMIQLVKAELADGVPMNDIAYLSFTKAANNVIRERLSLKDRDQDARLFSTIHSAASQATRIGGAVMDVQDLQEFSEFTGLKINPYQMDPEDFRTEWDEALFAWGVARNTGRSIEDVVREMDGNTGLTQARAVMFVGAYEAYKQNIRKFDYTDMLTRYIEVGAPLDVTTIFLDEAQDLSKLEWEAFEKMASKAARVYIAGDDDQAIYGWKGGSEYGFLDRPCDAEIILSKSYRCHKDVGHLAQDIIRHVDKRKAKEVQWREGKGELRYETLEAEYLPWNSYLDEFEDIMVLTRHKAGAKRFSEYLEFQRIPHTVMGISPTQWKEFGIAELYTRLKAGDTVTPLQAKKLLDYVTGGKETLAKGKLKRFSRHDIPLDFDHIDWPHLLAGKSDFKYKRFQIIKRILDSGEKYASRVSVMTMHGSKGHEADLVVIVPDCNIKVLDNVDKPGEVRLAYVAVTRAKKKLIILQPRTPRSIKHFGA